MFNHPSVEVAGVMLTPSMSSHYSNLFDTFLNTEKEKLEDLKPLLIQKYEGSREWGPNIYNDDQLLHPILGGTPYVLVKEGRYQAPAEYSISAGWLNEYDWPPSDRYGRTLEKFEVERILEEELPRIFPEVRDIITSFYEPGLPEPRAEEEYLVDNEYY